MKIDIKEGFRKICQGVEYIVMILDVPIAGLIGVLNMEKLMGNRLIINAKIVFIVLFLI